MDNKELLVQISEIMEEHTRRIEIKIENEVTGKIEALLTDTSSLMKSNESWNARSSN